MEDNCLCSHLQVQRETEGSTIAMVTSESDIGTLPPQALREGEREGEEAVVDTG